MAGEPLRAIVGLGNPGAEYCFTRHNVGFWFVDALAQAHAAAFRRAAKLHGHSAAITVAGQSVLLFKPETFMNDSGRAVQALATYYKLKPHQLLVVHDDLDLSPGVARFKRGGGHGGHNGLRSVHQHIGSDYLRLRIGIGHPGLREQVLGYVLGRPATGDQEAILEALGRAAAAVQTLLAAGWDKATLGLHSTAQPTEDGGGAA